MTVKIAALGLGVWIDHAPAAKVKSAVKSFPAGRLVIESERRVQAKTADSGPTVHVSDAQTGDELLRFDMFLANPHYHYIYPGNGNLVVRFDTNALGPMMDWVRHHLPTHLADMLRFADAEELASAIDPELIAPALEDALNTAIR
jgi:hypothetical protein